jgi:hypothetical protein
VGVFLLAFPPERRRKISKGPQKEKIYMYNVLGTEFISIIRLKWERDVGPIRNIVLATE